MIGTVRCDSCAALLAWPDGARQLIGHDAVMARVEPTLYRDAGRVVAEVDARTRSACGSRGRPGTGTRSRSRRNRPGGSAAAERTSDRKNSTAGLSVSRGRMARWGSRRYGPGSPVGAAAAALGVAELVAAATGARSAPLTAVGGVVVDHVPAAVKDFGIAVFGVHDKTALLTGTTLLLAAYAFGVGVLGRRWWPAAVGGIALFGLVGAVAAVTRPGAGAAAVIPSVLGAGLAVLVLRHLLHRPRRSRGNGGACAERRPGTGSPGPAGGDDRDHRVPAGATTRHAVRSSRTKGKVVVGIFPNLVVAAVSRLPVSAGVC